MIGGPLPPQAILQAAHHAPESAGGAAGARLLPGRHPGAGDGGLVSDWGAPYNTTTGAPGLNPCLDAPVTGADGTNFGTYQEYLASKGVVFGTYMIKVDTIVAARTTRAEMSQIWKAVQTKFVPEDQVISVIAFRGQNRSEAQYVVSNSVGRTDGTGIVQQLSLMVGWDRGTFNGFTWYNGGPCDSCGGMSSSKCIQTQYQPDYQQYTQSTCAWTFDECACNATNPLQCAASNCTSAIYVGHRGSDKPGRTMKTGSQIEKINQFSITSFFWRLLDSAFNLLGNAGIGTANAASVNSTSQPTVRTNSGTDAELAASQQVQQAQGQPLASGSR